MVNKQEFIAKSCIDCHFYPGNRNFFTGIWDFKTCYEYCWKRDLGEFIYKDLDKVRQRCREKYHRNKEK